MHDTLKDVLELFAQPAFLAQDGIVVWCNAAARALLTEGQDITQWVDSDMYSLWSRKGTLQTTLYLDSTLYDTSVRTTPEGDLFVASKSDISSESTAAALLCASAYLRRPLQTITGAARDLFDRADEMDAVDHTCALLNQSIYQLLRLCGQMTDGGQLLLHRRSAHRIPTDMRAFFDFFVKEVAPLTEGCGVNIRLKSSGIAPLFADIDADLITRALYNLIANALSYTPRGGEIELFFEKRGKLLFVTLTDNGEGISKDVAANLFQRFGPRTAGDSRWGLGLGLPMVREIARLHGGSLSLSDNPEGSGTCASFTISLEPTVLKLRSRTLQYSYCSDYHAGLVELSDVLPADMYDPNEVL